MTEQINENIWLLRPHGVVVSFTDPTAKVNPDAGKPTGISFGANRNLEAKIMSWGSRNNLPAEREALVRANNIIPELLGTKRDITCGLGLVCYKKMYVEGKEQRDFVETPPELEAFWKRIKVRKYLRAAARSLILHGNVFTEFVRDADGVIASIKCLEPRHVRAGEQDGDGVIRHYYHCTKWHRLRDEDAVITRIEAYDPAQKQDKFILHTGDDLLHDDYYYIPRWWGAKDWIDLACRIPNFHRANLGNGYMIRYHIQVPRDYFRDTTASQQSADDLGKSKTRMDEARRNFISKLNEFLAGENNSGRSVVTEYEINRTLGREFPGIKIEALPVDLKDEAMLKLFGSSNDAILSGTGVPAALGMIQTPGRLGTGSETRNSFILFVAIKTPVNREILFEPLELAHEENGYDSTLLYAIKDIEITTLDKNETGAEQKVMTQ